uniref:Translation initiation factor IF-3, chloroplastic n=1 Tax=Kapraunia schneideri TaxID=717899 RepID=A0A1Z1MSS5_9FLOR|nr:translation initiation factor 3 [Kapraunia schneideri]ARW68882.1 translation initiation factor 3 [Kapraunia schneideri]
MKKKYENEFLVNESINYPKIRLINSLGEQMGIYSSNEALLLASEEGLDLVLISDKSKPPVCKIIDYGKYKFSQEKKAKEAKKKQHNTVLKEVKMRYKIEQHDYQVRINQALRFLQAGDKVKATIILKGREIQHTNLAIELLKKMAIDLKDISTVQQIPTKDGRSIIMILNPSKKQ